MTTARCDQCGRDLPVDRFAKNASKRSGYSSACKECTKQYYRGYYAKHRDSLCERSNRYYYENRALLLQKGTAHRIKHREHISARKHRFYAANRDAILGEMRTAYKKYSPAQKQRRADNTRQWRALHPERTRAFREKWNAANPEKHREIQRRYNASIPARKSQQRWQQKNLEKVRKYRRESECRRRAMKKGALVTLTPSQWAEILARHEGRCQYCGTTEHITMDHVQPLSRGGTHAADNIVPACVSCNSRKGTHTLEDWLAIAQREEERWPK